MGPYFSFSRKSSDRLSTVHNVKLNPDGALTCLDARLVTKRYPKFMVLTTMTHSHLFRILISLPATHDLPLHQLDIKNVFLYDVLDEEVYMKQPSGSVAQGQS